MDGDRVDMVARLLDAAAADDHGERIHARTLGHEWFAPTRGTP